MLITCDRYPSPLQEGLVLRIYHYVRNLRERHEFDLLCFERTGQIRDATVEELFGVVTRVPYPEVATQGLFEKVWATLDPDELYVRSEDFRVAAKAAAAERRYDLIWDAGCNVLPNLTEVRSALPLLADQVDDAFLGIRRQLALGGSLRRRITLRKQLMLQRQFARRHIANASAVLFVSELDERSFLAACPGAPTVTIANGVDEVYFTPSGVEPAGFRGRPEVVFEGVMCFSPNVDAATYFVSEIFPLLKERIRDVHCSLVGRDPSPTVWALKGEDVEVTGFVEDVRPWLEGAHVFVCPMRSGAGIKNKILQAWAMGKAVVSTPEGAFGLPVEHGKNIMLCSSPAEFAEAAAILIREPSLRSALGAEARKTIESGYSWASKARELECLMERIVVQHRRASR